MNNPRPYESVLLPGDGVGVEVMSGARSVLEAALGRYGVDMRLTTIPCGGAYFLQHGRDWPEGAEDACSAADVIILGSMGLPEPNRRGWPLMRPDGRMAGRSAVLGNRQRLEPASRPVAASD